MEYIFTAEVINATKFKLGSSAGFAWLVSSLSSLLVVTLYPKGIVLWMSVYHSRRQEVVCGMGLTNYLNLLTSPNLFKLRHDFLLYVVVNGTLSKS